MADTERITFMASRAKATKLVLMSVVMIAVSAFCLRIPSVIAQVVGIAGLLLFGAGGIYAVWKLVNPGVALELSAEGLLDCASAVSVGLLRWDEIAEIEPQVVMGQRMLGIHPRDTEAVLGRLPAWKRRLLESNRSLGFAPISIPESVLPLGIDELHRMILNRYGHLLGKRA